MKILTDGFQTFFKESIVEDITAESYLRDSAYPNFDYKMVTVYSPYYIFFPRHKSKGEPVLRDHSLLTEVPRCALCLGLGSKIPSSYSPSATVRCTPPSAPFTSEHPFIVLKPDKKRRPALQGSVEVQETPGPKRHSKPLTLDEEEGPNLSEEICSVKRVMWIHQACAKYSPGIHYADGDWYNILEAVKRGKEMVGYAHFRIFWT